MSEICAFFEFVSHRLLAKFNYHPHAFCVSHPDGIGRMDTTTRGSQNVPFLPVAQHLSPSLRVMAFLADLSGGAGGQPFSVTMR